MTAGASPAPAATWASWVAGALVVAAVVVADPAGLSPFGPAKWLVVTTLGIATAAVASRLTAAEQPPWSRWSWPVLVAVIAVSATVHDDALVAWLGHPVRHAGVLLWVLCWTLFEAGRRVGATAAGRRVLGVSATVAAAWLGGYALWEAAFGRPIAIAVTTSRLTGPFGSAALTGAAGALLAPIVVGVALDVGRHRALRIFAAVASALVLFAVVGTGARAAWIGLIIAGVAALWCQRSRRRSTAAIRSAWALLGAIVVAVAVLVVATGTNLGAAVERDHGAWSRVDEWRVASRVVAEHPLLGTGPESYRWAIADGIDGNYERSYGRNDTLPDRAHNAILDVAISGGVVAAAAWVVLVGGIVITAWRLGRARVGSSAVGLAAGVGAYAVQQMFLFPSAEVDPLWWLLAGAMVAVCPPRRVAAAGACVVRPLLPPRRRLVVIIALGVVAALALVAGTLDVAADRLARQALRASAAGDGRGAEAAADRAMALRGDQLNYTVVAATVHLRAGTLADTDRAIALLDDAHQRWPKDPSLTDLLGGAYLQRALITGDEADADIAVTHWRSAVATDPLRSRWQTQLGRAAALAGDLATARAAWAIADDLGDESAAALLARIGTP